jgi:lambda repressor-like predicted transcriptional regulator
MRLQTKKSGRHFATMAQMDVPQGRNGKHKWVVSAIIADLDHLQKGAALRIELEELGDTKENVRSALNRATRKLKRNVATASDGQFLYVWTVND